MLSDRELQVVHLLTLGATNPEIARELSITVNTVKTHVGRVQAKWEVRGRVRLAVEAVKRGAFELGRREADWGLTRREVQVLQAVTDTGALIQAARVLNLSPSTTKSHMVRIGEKMGTGRKVCLVMRAAQAGIVTL